MSGDTDTTYVPLTCLRALLGYGEQAPVSAAEVLNEIRDLADEADEVSQLRTYISESLCVSCGYEMDPQVCWCGSVVTDHASYAKGHGFVPNGCRCGYKMTPDMLQEAYTRMSNVLKAQRYAASIKIEELTTQVTLLQGKVVVAFPRTPMCNVCAGFPEHISGKGCICGGKGTLQAERDGLRDLVERMRSVVEAAEEWRESIGDGQGSFSAAVGLADAVDEYMKEES